MFAETKNYEVNPLPLQKYHENSGQIDRRSPNREQSGTFSIFADIEGTIGLAVD
jgi:hypothetical protein